MFFKSNSAWVVSSPSDFTQVQLLLVILVPLALGGTVVKGDSEGDVRAATDPGRHGVLALRRT